MKVFDDSISYFVNKTMWFLVITFHLYDENITKNKEYNIMIKENFLTLFKSSKTFEVSRL